MADDRADQLRAMEQVIETCRRKADHYDMPALVHLLRRAELSLSDHAARNEPPGVPRDSALSVPRSRIVRH